MSFEQILRRLGACHRTSANQRDKSKMIMKNFAHYLKPSKLFVIYYIMSTFTNSEGHTRPYRIRNNYLLYHYYMIISTTIVINAIVISIAIIVHSIICMIDAVIISFTIIEIMNHASPPINIYSIEFKTGIPHAK